MREKVSLGSLASAGVLDFGDGYRTKRSEHGTPGYRILRVADIGEGTIVADGPDFVSAKYADKINSKLSEPGDVLLTTKGTVGRVAIVPEGGEPLVYSPQLCYFRVGEPDHLNARYLSYWFRSKDFLRQASHRANNTDMAAYINLADIRSLELRLPRIDEQRAIAEVLGALDDKITANTRLAATAHELADALYSRAVNGLPKVRMSEALESVLGGTPKRSEGRYWDGGIPWASAKDVASAEFGVLLGTSESITRAATQETKVKPLPAGSVVLTARGTVGAVARLSVPIAINQSCYGFVPGVLPKSVLYFAVRSIADQTRSLAHGSVFDTITRRTFDFVEVPDGESAEIALLERELAKVLELGEARMGENAALAGTRDALLPRLMSGRVTVRDAQSVVEGVA